MILIGAAFLGARRAMAKDQRRPMPCSVPLWRLLLAEIGLLARRVGRWKVWGVVAVVFVSFLAVEVLLSSATPGPASAQAWRWVVALAVSVFALCAWAIVHAEVRTRAMESELPREPQHRTGAATRPR